MIDIVIAAATLAAVVVAMATARGAQSIAAADRRAAVERERSEREHDRERDRRRYRLESAMALLEAFERFQATLASNPTTSEAASTRGEFLARLRGSPEALPVLRKGFLKEEPVPPEAINQRAQELGADLQSRPASSHLVIVQRAEIEESLRRAFTELHG